MLKMGIIGMGKMAEFHASWMTPENGMELVGICEKNERRVVELKQKYQVPIYNDVDSLLNIHDLDFIVITTTNEVHADLAIKAMEHGKNVIVEKPMAMNYASTIRMIQTAEKTKKHLFVHQSARWDRDFLLLKKVLKSGVLGKLLMVRQSVMLCDEGWPSWGIEGMKNPWRIKAKYGGGMLYDWGPHLVDWAMQLVGKEPINVYCNLQNGVWGKEADDYCSGIMNFEDDLICHFEASNNARIEIDRFYVIGSKGTFVVQGRSVPTWDHAEMVYINEFGETVKQKWELIGVKESGIEGGFYRDLVPFLEGKKNEFVSMYEASRVIKVLELMQISNREKRVVSWGEI